LEPVVPSDAALADLLPDPTWPRWTAILLTSILFALVHNAGASSLWMLPPLFLLSVCIGYAYERTGTLWVPIFTHAAFNGLSLSVALFG
jgi:membrane protease YdiL (CAAX protease family)